MSQFEFSTKEEREAWRVLKPCYDKVWGGGSAGCIFDQAASRFDAREKTCGIEPLSEEHFALGMVGATEHRECVVIYTHGLLTSGKMTGLVNSMPKVDGHWILTDRGREVLANLNAMCKVQA